jgi:hypothetical protein
MPTGWQRQYAASGNAGRAAWDERRLRKDLQGGAHKDKSALWFVSQYNLSERKVKQILEEVYGVGYSKRLTQPLSRRFYCPNTYMHLGVERVCGYWAPSHVWWRDGIPYCDCCRTPLEIHPGMNPREEKKEQRVLRKQRMSAKKG